MTSPQLNLSSITIIKKRLVSRRPLRSTQHGRLWLLHKNLLRGNSHDPDLTLYELSLHTALRQHLNNGGVLARLRDHTGPARLRRLGPPPQSRLAVLGPTRTAVVDIRLAGRERSREELADRLPERRQRSTDDADVKLDAGPRGRTAIVPRDVAGNGDGVQRLETEDGRQDDEGAEREDADQGAFLAAGEVELPQHRHREDEDYKIGEDVHGCVAEPDGVAV